MKIPRISAVMLVLPLLAALAPLASVLRAGSCCASVGDSTPPASAIEVPTLPGASLYHLPAVWVDQDNQARTLAGFAGSPVLVSMVFTHCGYACPRTLEDLRAVRAALPAGVRERTRIVLVSFDVVRDIPPRLREWADLHGLDSGWTLLHGGEADVRELAVLLDIAFQRQPDGSFAHANRIMLLDGAGVPVATLDGLGASPAPLLEAAARLAVPAATTAAR